MAKRKKQEVQAEIEALRAIAAKPTFRKTTLFGDSNTEAIEAQIDVLEDGLSEEDVSDLEESGDLTEHAATSARDASLWLYGENDDRPSAEWEGLH